MTIVKKVLLVLLTLIASTLSGGLVGRLLYSNVDVKTLDTMLDVLEMAMWGGIIGIFAGIWLVAYIPPEKIDRTNLYALIAVLGIAGVLVILKQFT